MLRGGVGCCGGGVGGVVGGDGVGCCGGGIGGAVGMGWGWSGCCEGGVGGAISFSSRVLLRRPGR